MPKKLTAFSAHLARHLIQGQRPYQTLGTISDLPASDTQPISFCEIGAQCSQLCRNWQVIRQVRFGRCARPRLERALVFCIQEILAPLQVRLANFSTHRRLS